MSNQRENLINTLQKKGFKNSKNYNDHSVMSSTRGNVVVFDDGNYEGLVKYNINEIKHLKKAIELFLIFGLGLMYFTTDITIIRGNSMAPTYHDFQLIIKSADRKNVEKILISKNAVIKFKSPSGDTCIKRVIATPGDQITLIGPRVYVNDELVDSHNRDNNEKMLSKSFKDRSWYNKPIEFKLKDGEYYVMGDNRIVSVDSRNYGPVSKNCILSVVKK